METEYKGYRFDDKMVVNPDAFIPAGEYNPHNVRPYLIFNEYGPLCIVFVDSEQHALDEAVDNGRLDSCQIAEEDLAEAVANEEVTYLGNASEPFDLTNIGLAALPNPPYSWVAMFVAGVPAAVKGGDCS